MSSFITDHPICAVIIGLIVQWTPPVEISSINIDLRLVYSADLNHQACGCELFRVRSSERVFMRAMKLLLFDLTCL